MRNTGNRFIPGIRIEVKEEEPEEKVISSVEKMPIPGKGSDANILDKISGIRVTTEEFRRDENMPTNGNTVDDDDYSDTDGKTGADADDNDVDESFVVSTSKFFILSFFLSLPSLFPLFLILSFLIFSLYFSLPSHSSFPLLIHIFSFHFPSHSLSTFPLSFSPFCFPLSLSSVLSSLLYLSLSNYGALFL